jgi:signal peptide peptidase SppA
MSQPMRFFQFLAGQPWAITTAFATRMLEIYDLALERKARGEDFDKTALERELGRKLDNTRIVTIRNGVATIPIEGPIFRRADFFTEISGAIPISTLATDLNTAMENPDVKGVVLYIDSPGGEVNGTNEFSEMVFAARGKKPIVAYIAHLGASAAYWIASAADEIVVDATAAVGSIGVVAAVRDPSKSNSKSIEFVSSQSPNKRPDPTTEGGKAKIQGHVDDLAQVFVDAIAKNRGVDSETVVKDFGQGGLMVGQKAVEAGLADRVGSYESVLAELQTGKAKRHKGWSMNADTSAQTEKEMSDEKNTKTPRFPRLSAFLKTLPGAERGAAVEELTALAAEAKVDEELTAVEEPPAKPAAVIDKPAIVDAAAAAAAKVPGEQETVAAPPPPAKVEESAEIKELRARAERVESELAAQAKVRREEAAANYVATMIAIEKRLLPTSKDKALTLYIQAAEDDAASPLAAGSRLDTFKAFCADLPKHNLTMELTKADLPAGSHVLNPDSSSQEESLKADEQRSREWASRQQKGVKGTGPVAVQN